MAKPAFPRGPSPARESRLGGAEIAEWSYRLGTTKVTQTILLLAGRRIALLSALFEARAPLPAEPERSPGTSPVDRGRADSRDCRGFRLTGPKRSDSAQVLPIALPSLSYETERGGFLTDGELAGAQPSTCGPTVLASALGFVGLGSESKRAQPGES